MAKRRERGQRGTLFHPVRPFDANVCRVCGHRTIPPARRALNRLLLVLIGMLLAYIVLDVAHNGALDESLYRVIQRESQLAR